jgi:hypothetical protein
MRVGRQRSRDCRAGQRDERVAVRAKQREVRIGGGELAPKPGLDLGRVGAGKTAIAGAQPEHERLVVLCALDSQRTAVGPVRQDIAKDFGHLEWLVKPPRIDSGKVGDEQVEEALEITHEACRFDREGRLEIVSPSVKQGAPMRWILIEVALVVGLVGQLSGQAACRPPASSNEAKILANFAVPLAFAPLAAPAPVRTGSLRFTLEGSYLPTLDAATRTATICRPGKGPEATDLLFAFPRPRVAVGLPGNLLLEASWIPPVRLNGVKANLGGVALARGFGLGQRPGIPMLGIRLHASFGLVEAPITCDDEALADASSECYQGTRSNDHYHPGIYGAEASLGWLLAGGRVRPYVGGGVNLLRPRFQVQFVNRFGDVDSTRVEVNLTRGVAFAGITWETARGFGVGGEIYAAPADAVTARVALSYAWR